MIVIRESGTSFKEESEMSEQESGNHGHPDASDELDHDVEAHKHHGRDAAAAAEKPSDDFEAHKHHGREKHHGRDS